MRRSTTVTLMLAAVICLTSLGNFGLTSQAFADSYANGYVNAAGYTWNDGYWWKGEQAYSLAAVQEYYYYNGCRCSHVVNKYTPVAVKKVVITKQDLSEDGWRGKLLEIAKQRDAYEGYARKSTVEHNEFVESIRVLGLEGNFRWNGYGYEMNYAKGGVADPYGQVANVAQDYAQIPAQQGQTVYGYRELADIYGNVDLGALYNSVLRLRSQSYSNEANATSETHALVGELGNQMARIKEIEAQGNAAAAALTASQAKDRTTLLREFWQSYPQGSAGQPATPPAAAAQPDVSAGDNYRNLTTLVQAKCVQCHNSTKQNGGLNLEDLSKLTAEQGEHILQRIIHPDPTKRMPVAADGSPGQALNAAEVAQFFIGAYGGSSGE